MIGFFKNTLIFIVAAILFRQTFLEAFRISSTAMAPIFQGGDAVMVNKLSYGIRLPFLAETLFTYSSPQREDVVVYTREDDPTTDVDESTINLLHRVAGLPGEKIEVSGDTITIDGKKYDDSAFANWFLGGTQDFPPTVIPENHFFLLGDNRDYSLDARFYEDPFINISRIKGRVFARYWDYRDGEKITYSKMRWDSIEPSSDYRGYEGVTEEELLDRD